MEQLPGVVFIFSFLSCLEGVGGVVCSRMFIRYTLHTPCNKQDTDIILITKGTKTKSTPSDWKLNLDRGKKDLHS
jgi:hypothetical protein